MTDILMPTSWRMDMPGPWLMGSRLDQDRLTNLALVFDSWGIPDSGVPSRMAGPWHIERPDAHETLFNTVMAMDAFSFDLPEYRAVMTTLEGHSTTRNDRLTRVDRVLGRLDSALSDRQDALAIGRLIWLVIKGFIG